MGQGARAKRESAQFGGNAPEGLGEVSGPAGGGPEGVQDRLRAANPGAAQDEACPACCAAASSRRRQRPREPHVRLQEDPDCQPGRDRHPSQPRRQRAGEAHRQRLCRGGQAEPPPLQDRRELPDRRGQGAGRGLSLDRRDHSRGEGQRGGRDPSGLWAAEREPGLRRRLRGGGDRLHRPSRGNHADAGRQGERAPGGDRRRGAGGAGDRGAARSRRAGGDGAHPGDGRRGRLSADAEGELGRRRARDAPDRRAGCAGRRRARGPARGRGGLWQR